MTSADERPGILRGQALHYARLATLVASVLVAWKYLDEPYPYAFWIAVACPIVHQVFVWLAWRFEIQSSATSRLIGFRAYLVLFFMLFASRFISLFALAWLDRGSLKLGVTLQIIMTAVLVALGAYAGYSVKRYFGMARAAGADHFDPRYRDLPLVNEGIFRFTNNGMYVYAFLSFWAIAIGLNSTAALTVAAFSHAYIWVHFYATEKPDMDYLYGTTT